MAREFHTTAEFSSLSACTTLQMRLVADRCIWQLNLVCGVTVMKLNDRCLAYLAKRSYVAAEVKSEQNRKSCSIE